MHPTPEDLVHTSEFLLELIQDPDRFIDEGGASKVYRVSERVCVKVLREHYNNSNPHKSQMQLGNSIDVEAAFLHQLAEVTVQGVRTPEYLMHVKESEISAIVMEELHAVNLERVLLGKDSLPETFNHHAFFEALEKYITEMHDTYGIAHGDLEARNIMVDRETGEPRLIDFGRASWLKKLPKDKQEVLKKADWDTLEKTEALLAAFGQELDTSKVVL